MIQQAMAAVLIAGVLTAGAYFYGRHDGAVMERDAWMDRENTELREANKAIDALHAKARAEEQKRAEDQAKIVGDYQEELSNVENERDRALAAVRSGELRLRVRTAASEATCKRRSAEAAASAAASVQAAAESELPGAREEAVIRLLSEADEVVKEVNVCWAVVRSDRGAL